MTSSTSPSGKGEVDARRGSPVTCALVSRKSIDIVSAMDTEEANLAFVLIKPFRGEVINDPDGLAPVLTICWEMP